MKKLTAFLLALVLIFSLCACGKNSAGESSNETSTANSTASVVSNVSSQSEASSAASSETESSKTSSVASATSSATSSTVSKKDYSNSTETINILRQNNAVDYKGKIITPYAILNSDYSIHTYYENNWECRRYISVYDGKIFYHDDVAEKYQTRNAIFTCDQNGKNVKEIVKSASFGIYTIYQGRIYYIGKKYETNEWKKYLCSSNIDGTDEKGEICLENIGDVYFAVVKDSVLYCWIYEGEALCIAKFDPKSKKFEIAKRYSEPSTRHRSELHLVGNDIYYHFGEHIYKVNFKGEDTALPVATNESETYLLNKAIAFWEQGIMVMDSRYDSVNDPIDFFAFNDLSTKKVAPKSLYTVAKANRENTMYSFVTCQKKDKVILFEYSK
ncbi:MAG: hypothetical protein E7548_06245 [Ruminococcaceae bacterium]|nr:hypothetical protein [Oscillospiraceae bacterium]